MSNRAISMLHHILLLMSIGLSSHALGRRGPIGCPPIVPCVHIAQDSGQGGQQILPIEEGISSVLAAMSGSDSADHTYPYPFERPVLNYPISCLLFDDAGRLVVRSASQRQVLSQNEFLPTEPLLPAHATVTVLARSLDDYARVVSWDNQVFLCAWGRLLAIQQSDAEEIATTLVHDRRGAVVLPYSSGRIDIYHPDSPVPTAVVLADDRPTTVTMDNRSGIFYAGTASGRVVVIDIDSGRIINSLPTGLSYVTNLCIDRSQSILYASDDRHICKLTSDRPDLTAVVSVAFGTTPVADPILALATSQDGSRVIVASGRGLISVINSTSGHTLLTFQRPSSQLQAMAISTDGRYLACGYLDGKVWIWPNGKSAAQALLHGSDLIADYYRQHLPACGTEPVFYGVSKAAKGTSDRAKLLPDRFPVDWSKVLDSMESQLSCAPNNRATPLVLGCAEQTHRWLPSDLRAVRVLAVARCFSGDALGALELIETIPESTAADMHTDLGSYSVLLLRSFVACHIDDLLGARLYRMAIPTPWIASRQGLEKCMLDQIARYIGG